MIKTGRLVTESDLSTDLKEVRESIKQIRRGRMLFRSGEQVQQRPRDGMSEEQRGGCSAWNK